MCIVLWAVNTEKQKSHLFLYLFLQPEYGHILKTWKKTNKNKMCYIFTEYINTKCIKKYRQYSLWLYITKYKVVNFTKII